jgi:hypothetical protein
VTVLLEKREKSLPHFGKTVRLSCGRVLEERVRGAPFRGGFSAGFLTRILGPVIFLALRTELPHETLFLEEGKRVFFCWKSFQVIQTLRSQPWFF